jgi:hypothetical protein
MIICIFRVESDLNFFVNAILIRYSFSHTFELCHVFKGFIVVLHFGDESQLCISFSLCFTLDQRLKWPATEFLCFSLWYFCFHPVY